MTTQTHHAPPTLIHDLRWLLCHAKGHTWHALPRGARCTRCARLTHHRIATTKGP